MQSTFLPVSGDGSPRPVRQSVGAWAYPWTLWQKYHSKGTPPLNVQLPTYSALVLRARDNTSRAQRSKPDDDNDAPEGETGAELYRTIRLCVCRSRIPYTRHLGPHTKYDVGKRNDFLFTTPRAEQACICRRSDPRRRLGCLHACSASGRLKGIAL